ncbi:hypothetical protein SynRS9907_01952 [Synechococcus sp. RS9907]|nr:hypothetical protein SynRS9907_01952 [Synechococcus sp. RS9907]
MLIFTRSDDSLFEGISDGPGMCRSIATPWFWLAKNALKHLKYG